MGTTGLAMNKQGKPYLIFIRVGKRQPEHANILKTLEKISCSPPTQMFFNQGIAFGFRSTMNVGQMSGAVTEAKIFFNEDSYILVELGSYFLAFRADPAKAWLNQNLD